MTSNRPETFPFPRTSPLDPAPEYARLRTDDPVSRVVLPSGDTAWIATRHADVRRVYSDSRFSRAAALGPQAPTFSGASPQAPASITYLDPPQHTRLRHLIAPAFNSSRIQVLSQHIQRIADELVEAMADDGPPADLLTRLAQPLSIKVICHLLGVPYQDHARFQAWGEAAVNITVGGAGRVREARSRLEGYLSGLITSKRREPGDDLLSTLITEHDEGDVLSEDELLDLGIALLLAGYETTARQITCSVLDLLLHPDQLALLRRSPHLLEGAVEELLRHVPLTTINFMRVATEDVELSGVRVEAGDGVLPATVSANRDATVFANPDVLDVTRTDNPHVAFGYGAHYCVGAQLARTELHVAIEALLRRFPALALAVSEADLSWRSDLAMTTLNELPVTW